MIGTASTNAPLPVDARDLMLRAGIAEADFDHVVVERTTTTPDGTVHVEALTLAEWAAANADLIGLSQTSAVPPAVPQATVGGVFHIMLQFGNCAGYDDQVVADDIRLVEGNWDLGVHITGLADYNGVNAADLPTSAQGAAAAEDSGVRGVGDVTIVESHFILWGICHFTQGTMYGSGVFWFDPAELPAPEA